MITLGSWKNEIKPYSTPIPGIFRLINFSRSLDVQNYHSLNSFTILKITTIRTANTAGIHSGANTHHQLQSMTPISLSIKITTKRKPIRVVSNSKFSSFICLNICRSTWIRTTDPLLVRQML